MTAVGLGQLAQSASACPCASATAQQLCLAAQEHLPQAARVERLTRCAPPALQILLQRVQDEFVAPLQPLASEGVRRLALYQDAAYAALYLDRLAVLRSWIGSHSTLLRAAIGHLALWMSYEDSIAVASQQLRATRRMPRAARCQGQLQEQPPLAPTHWDEICDSLPQPLGPWLARPHAVHRLLKRWTVEPTGAANRRGWILLWSLARLRVLRRRTQRYQREEQRIVQWLALVAQASLHDSALALEILRCQRLLGGQGERYRLGQQHFEQLMGVVLRQGRHLRATTLRQLRKAALADDGGCALQCALARLVLD